MKTIDEILTMIQEMPYDKKEALAYFTSGMLYGMSVLEMDGSATVRLLNNEEETE